MLKHSVTFFLLAFYHFLSFAQVQSKPKPIVRIEFGMVAKLMTINMLDGIAPAGYAHHKNTLSANYFGNILAPLNSNLDLIIGAEYNVDRYKSRILFDYKVNELGYYGIWSVKSTEYLTPNFGLMYHFNGKLKNLSAAVLAKYKPTNTLSWQSAVQDDFIDVYGDTLTVYRAFGVKPTESSKLGCQLQIRYGFKLWNQLQASVGLTKQFSNPYAEVVEFFKIDQKEYQFRYERNSSFWGFNVSLNYPLKSKS